MPLYEHILLGRQDISAQQFEGLIEGYQTIIKDNGGAVEKTESWGIKNLSYKIKKNRKAHFAMMNINAPHEAVAEMERQMSISTDVIRFLTLRVNEHDEAPSAMMKRGDRDDRRGGRRDSRDGGPRRDHSGGKGRDERPAAAAVPSRDDAPKAETPKTEAAGDDKSGDGKAEE